MTEYITSLHAIEEYIKKGENHTEFYFSKMNPRIKKLKQLAEQKGIRIVRVSDKELSEHSGILNHKGAAIGFNKREESIKKYFTIDEYLNSLNKKNALVLILDGITDTHNYGAILRSADQFAVDVVIIPSRRSAGDRDFISKTSAGSNIYVNTITVQNITRCLEQLKEKNFWVYGAAAKGEKVDKTELTGRIALVMGSEGKGLSRLVMETCDVLISIPAKGNIDSFNVSVAAGILMYEIKRQQGFK